MYTAIIGFLMITAIVALLLKGKMAPVVVLISIPVVGALLTGFGIGEIGEFIKGGVTTTMGTAILFIFSVIFFGIMEDVGLFDILVEKLVRQAGANVVAITVVTAIVAIIAHLDGATAVTVMITIPAMFPIYKKLNMRPQVLLCITAASMGVMNLLPWGGPTARVAAVLGMDATELWHILIPIQIFGVFVTLGLAVILGLAEKKRGAGLAKGETLVVEVSAAQQQEKDRLRRPKLLWFNALLTVGLIAVLMIDILPSYVVFMIFVSVALMINYPSLKEQDARIKAHAPSALIIAATMIGAGAMVGIMSGTGMMETMARVMINVIPSFLGQYIHVIFGIFALPLGMVVGTDAYFYGIMPLVMEVGQQYGITALNTGLTMIIGKNVGLMISPLVPATFLALSLVNVELKDHIRFSFKRLAAVSLVMLTAGFVFSIITL